MSSFDEGEQQSIIPDEEVSSISAEIWSPLNLDISSSGVEPEGDIDTDTSVSESEMVEIRQRTRARREEEGILPTRLDFGNPMDEEFQGMSPAQPQSDDLEQFTYKTKPCVIPDEIKALNPTVPDDFKFEDILAGPSLDDDEDRGKTIKQHLEDVDEDDDDYEDGEIPDRVIFMNQAKNQFAVVDKSQILKMIYPPTDDENPQSAVFYKCKKMMDSLLITRNDVEYDTPYFDLRRIGYPSGGYVELSCILEILFFDLVLPQRVFMIVEPSERIEINPVANELAITTHRYKTTEVVTKISNIDGVKSKIVSEQVIDTSSQLNILEQVVNQTSAAHCQEGQFSNKVFMIPITSTDSGKPVYEESSSSFNPEEEDLVTSELPSLDSFITPSPEARRVIESASTMDLSGLPPLPPSPSESRGGKKTLRKKNLLKKKRKNKTKRKKSNKNKKSKK
jgi:hypothetical protein